MAGNVCEYINCDRTRRKVPGLKMFRFPKDIYQARKWIISCGNALLDRLSLDELHKRFICEFHFNENDFVNPLLKSRLKNTSIPSHYNVIEPQKTESEIKTYVQFQQISREQQPFITLSSESSGSEEWLEKLTDLPVPTAGTSSSTELKEELQRKDKIIDKLKKKLAEKNKKINIQNSKIFRLKSCMNKVKLAYKTRCDFSNFNFTMEYSGTLVRMQMKKKHRAWFPDEKKLSLILYYKSPSAFRYLRRLIVLPSVSTIKQWIGKSNFMPGLNKYFLHQVKLKISTLPEINKKAILSFDEMAIKEYLEYSKYLDLIEGYEDLGYLGRTKQVY